jgi:hypothetical protein
MSKKDKPDKKKHKKKKLALAEAARVAPVALADVAAKPKAKTRAIVAAGSARHAVEETVAAETSEPTKSARTRTLPKDRESLLKLHRELRRTRDAAPLLSEERAEAVIELAAVEVEVARIERAMDPPLV